MDCYRWIGSGLCSCSVRLLAVGAFSKKDVEDCESAGFGGSGREPENLLAYFRPIFSSHEQAGLQNSHCILRREKLWNSLLARKTILQYCGLSLVIGKPLEIYLF